MVGLKPSDVPPPLGVKMASAGAAACIADIVTFPLDTAKVRLQVSDFRLLLLLLPGQTSAPEPSEPLISKDDLNLESKL